jgi:hypothetical protein
MEPEGLMRIHKDYPIFPNLGLINPFPRIDTYFFKLNSKIVPHLRLGFPEFPFPLGLSTC